MALKSYIILMCCLGFSMHHVSATSSSEDSSDEDVAVVDAQYILDLANASRDALTKLVGKIMKNLEKNLSEAMMESRVDAFHGVLCWKTECSPWSDWSECPSSDYGYSKSVRSRECGRNNSHCVYAAFKNRTETESRWCISEQKQTGEQEESTTTVATTTDGEDTNAPMASHTTTQNPNPATDVGDASPLLCPNDFTASQGLCLRLVTKFKLTHSMADQLCSWQQSHLINTNTLKARQSLYQILTTLNYDGPVWVDGIASNVSDPVVFKHRNGWPAGEMKQVYKEMPEESNASGQDLCKVDLGISEQKWSLMPCENTFLAFVCNSWYSPY